MTVPTPTMEHDWFPFKNLTCCRKCGIVQRHDGQNKPCKGIVHVKLREDERDTFDNAWSAMQHSEDMAIKSIRRKLSIHELRSFLLLMCIASRRSTEGKEEVIEECAKVADGVAERWESERKRATGKLNKETRDCCSFKHDGARGAAFAIRALSQSGR